MTPAHPPLPSTSRPRRPLAHRCRRLTGRAAGTVLTGLAVTAAAVTVGPGGDRPRAAAAPVTAHQHAPPFVVAAPAVPPRPVQRTSRGAARTGLPVRHVVRTVPVGASFSGLASWYGGSFQGRRTANGERFNTHDHTAASKTLPFGTRLRVCHHGCVVVRINDRGPYVGSRILDLSQAAARAIGYDGVAHVTATPVAQRTVAMVDRGALLRQRTAAAHRSAAARKAALARARAEQLALAEQGRQDALAAEHLQAAAAGTPTGDGLPLAALAGGLVLLGAGGLAQARRRRTVRS